MIITIRTNGISGLTTLVTMVDASVREMRLLGVIVLVMAPGLIPEMPCHADLVCFSSCTDCAREVPDN